MLGQPVVHRLARDGYNVRLMTRYPERAGKLFDSSVQIVVGDVTDPGSLMEPVEGCDTVYVNLNARMIEADYERIEHEGTVNVARVAAEHDVRRIAMISSLNAGCSDLKFAFAAAKAGAEKALIDCGIPYTIFRCCNFFESLPMYVVRNRAVIFGRQPHRLSWMAASDYAVMVSKAFSADEARNRIFHVRGIDKLTMHEALERFCRIASPEAKVTHTPTWMVSAVSRLSRNRRLKGLAEFMRFSNRNPETDANGGADEILGPALTTLQDWAEEYKRIRDG